MLREQKNYLKMNDIIGKQKYMTGVNLQTGITLIALVVTIVVLLILAGISISLFVGEDGIISKTQQVKEKAEEAQRREQAELEAMTLMLEMQTTGEICNKPNLKTGMIPVKWNGIEWVKADEKNTGNSWYNYSKNRKQWANVVTVKETGTKTREEYKSAPVGTAINMDDITTMFVWIPRYAYKIDENSYHKNVDGTANVEIEWLVGTTNISVNKSTIVEYNEQTTENYTKFPNGYVVHPAFTDNTDMGGTGEEITGFWVGKFESSNYQMAEEHKNNEGITNDSDSVLKLGQGDGANVTIKPNVTSWRSIDVSNIYQVCQNMSASANIHGLEEDTTTVMMQNSQWGAVAYLSQSDYGNKQTTQAESGIWKNPYFEGFTYATQNNAYGIYNYCTNMTGMAGDTKAQSSNYYSKVKPDTETEKGKLSMQMEVLQLNISILIQIEQKARNIPIHIIVMIQSMEYMQVQQEQFMEFMICQAARGNIWQVI